MRQALRKPILIPLFVVSAAVVAGAGLYSSQKSEERTPLSEPSHAAASPDQGDQSSQAAKESSPQVSVGIVPPSKGTVLSPKESQRIHLQMVQSMQMREQLEALDRLPVEKQKRSDLSQELDEVRVELGKKLVPQYQKQRLKAQELVIQAQIQAMDQKISQIEERLNRSTARKDKLQ